MYITNFITNQFIVNSINDGSDEALELANDQDFDNGDVIQEILEE